MRLGVFGGSFDPPHLGHLLAAQDAAEQLRLDRLIWVTAARQPLKQEGADSASQGASHAATPEQRYAMVAATIAGVPKCEASRIEIDRSGLSYTVTTVQALATMYSDAELILLVGEDAWADFDRWHEPDRIRTLVQVAVLARAGDAAALQGSSRGPEGPAPDYRLQTRVVDVSSTEIRARVRAGQSIRGFVRDGVADFIESERLYRW